MKKKILIIHSNMELGGVETSLLGLLDTIDYDLFEVDVFLYAQEGSLIDFINPKANLLPEKKEYRALMETIKSNWEKGFWRIGAARIFAKIRSKLSRGPLHYGHNYKQLFHKLSIPFLTSIAGEYDLAISFNDPHYVIGKKVNAKIKMSWFHTDASRMEFCDAIEKEMWSMSDYVVNVSEDCKQAFDEKHLYMTKHSIVVENILSKRCIQKRSIEFDSLPEMPLDGNIRILSVGRFTYPKNFDQIPEIVHLIRKSGINIKWYLIGYGGEEDLIRKRIKEFGMENNVIILGKKENPYPYIKACDIYAQPSRYEGKSVAVREAQILNKPVVITNYATAGSQLENGIDGLIVPMDIKGCAEGIIYLLQNPELQQQFIENTKKRDYTNAGEIDKIYRIME